MDILIPIAILGGLGFIFAIGLSYASKKFAVEIDPKIEQVEEALAGLNCGVCGYPGCKKYAEAMKAKWGLIWTAICPLLTMTISRPSPKPMIYAHRIVFPSEKLKEKKKKIALSLDMPCFSWQQ